jgi:FAD/FMN-containing dehydrogenase
VSIDTTNDLRALRARMTGPVLAPGDAGWDDARRAWLLNVDQRPAAIAVPADAADVMAVMRFARRAGLRVAPQATGHAADSLGSLVDTILLKTAAMRAVRIDPKRRRATVGAGAIWDDVVAPAAAHGLAALHGSSPDVGVAGYSLGGGLGFYARRHGLQTNHLTTVELVTPDGELRRVDDEHEAELFWALRGGGGNFGVVTALEFELLAIRELFAGALIWDWRHAGPVLLRWSEWAQTAPDLISTTARIMQFPPLPELPAGLRGRQLVMIHGAYLGPAEEAAPVLEPLRNLNPELDTFARMAPDALLRLHGDPEQPTPVVGAHSLLAALPREGVEAFLETAGPGSGSPLVIAELRQLGGALGRRPERHGALPTLDGAFLTLAGTMAPDEPTAAAGLAHAHAVTGALAPWSTGRPYLNFGHSLPASEVAAAFDPPAYRRLAALRARLDPDGLLHPGHPIPTSSTERDLDAR